MACRVLLPNWPSTLMTRLVAERARRRLLMERCRLSMAAPCEPVSIIALLSPHLCVSRSPLDERLSKQAGIAVVNGVVGPFGGEDKVLGIEHPSFTLHEILWCHRVDVMHQRVIAHLVARNAEIASVVPDDHEAPSISPFT